MAEEQKDELKEQLAKSLAFLKVGAKNFLHLKGIARDLNVASQNIQLLLKAVGGEPRKSGQTDMHILTPDQIDKKLEVDVAKATVVPKETEEEKKPSLVGKAFDKLKSSKAGKAVGEAFTKFKGTKAGGKIVSIASKIAKYAKIFSPSNIMLAFGGLSFLYVILQSSIFDPIVEGFKEFMGNIGEMFDSLKEGVVTFIDNLKESIGEIIDEITSNVAEFFKPFTDKVKEIYDKIVSFITDKIDKIKEFFGFKIEPKGDVPKLDEEKVKKEAEKEAEKKGKPKEKPVQKPAEAPAPTPTPAAPAPSPAPTPAAPPAAAAAAPQAAPAAAQATGPAPSLSSVVQVQSGVDTGGLNPELTKRIAMMASAFKEQTGKTLIVTSGFRSNEKQKQLYDDWKAGRLKAPAVAEPAPPLGKGKGSLHSSGLALDIAAGGPNKAPPDRDLNVLAGTRSSPTGWLEKFGLVRNVPGEDWHVQLAGTPPTADNPQNPGQPVAVPTKTGGAVEVDSGKKESISPVKGPPSTGTQVAAASSDVAAGQRQQAKPSTPVIINASTTNNTKVQKNETVAVNKPQNTAGMLAARAA
jgi:LAS superfamily LD-carboxypeptidase LdcB